MCLCVEYRREKRGYQASNSGDAVGGEERKGRRNEECGKPFDVKGDGHRDRKVFHQGSVSLGPGDFEVGVLRGEGRERE